MNAGVKQRIKEEQEYRCYICHSQGFDLHHIIHKSIAPELRDFKHNLIYVCRTCHMRIHHESNLDKQLKKQYKKKIEALFLNNKHYSIKEIAEISGMDEEAIEKAMTKGLLKFEFIEKEVKSSGREIVRFLMGGKLK